MDRYADLYTLRQSPLFDLIELLNENDELAIQDISPIYSPAWTFQPHHLWRFSTWRHYDFEIALQDDPALHPRPYDASTYDTSRELYNRIYPALQLATLMLQRSASFFVRLVRSPLLPDNRTLDPSWKPTNVDYAALDSALNLLAVDYRTLCDPPRRVPPRSGASSSTEGYNNPITSQNSQVINAVSVELLDEFRSDRFLAAPEIQKANMFLGLACILVHELAHAVWILRELTWAYTATSADMRYKIMSSAEPIVPHETFDELGFSWNNFLFGCVTKFPYGPTYRLWNAARNHRGLDTIPVYDGSDGIVVVLDHSPNKDRSQLSFHTLSLESVCSLFRERTWDPQQRQTLYFLPLVSEAVIRRQAQNPLDDEGDVLMR